MVILEVACNVILPIGALESYPHSFLSATGPESRQGSTLTMPRG